MSAPRLYPARHDVPYARASGALLLLTGLLLLTAPTRATADIYKWIDARGVTVLSNSPPEDRSEVTQLEVVAKEVKRSPGTGRLSTSREPEPAEHSLLERIEDLERELRAQQYAREAVVPSTPQHVIYATPHLAPSHGSPHPPNFYPEGYPPHAVPLIPFYPAVTTIVVRPKSHFHHHGVKRPFPHKGVFSHGGFAMPSPRTAAFPHTGFSRVTPHSGSTGAFPHSGFARTAPRHHTRR